MRSSSGLGRDRYGQSIEPPCHFSDLWSRLSVEKQMILINGEDDYDLDHLDDIKVKFQRLLNRIYGAKGHLCDQ